MQYGVRGATTNTSVNLVVFAYNSTGSNTPTAADFTLQMGATREVGKVLVLSTYSSPSDYLVRVSHALEWAQHSANPSLVCWRAQQLPSIPHVLVGLLSVGVTGESLLHVRYACEALSRQICRRFNVTKTANLGLLLSQRLPTGLT